MPSSLYVQNPLVLIRGRIRVPGDKSLSHRYLLLALLRQGQTCLENPGSGADVRSTAGICEALGAEVKFSDGRICLKSPGLSGLREPSRPLDCGNSGTTARLCCGLFAGLGLTLTLTGDKSLCQRPMRRILDPLADMGAKIKSREGKLPLELKSAPLQGICYRLPVESAQLKSALLLAGLFAAGETRVSEAGGSRDHTERMLGLLPETTEDGKTWTVNGRTLAPVLEQLPTTIVVPGDPSSGIFPTILALATANSQLEIDDLLLNPGRLAVFDYLKKCGAGLTWQEHSQVMAEPVGSLTVSADDRLILQTLAPADVPALIDEIPALAALAMLVGQNFSVSGAAELRVKESDRIGEILRICRAFGARCTEAPDGFALFPQGKPRPVKELDLGDDHRIAMMALCIAAGAEQASTLKGTECTRVSFPEFVQVINGLAQQSARP